VDKRILEIQVNFENPVYVSSTAGAVDKLQVIFWGAKSFPDENGDFILP